MTRKHYVAFAEAIRLVHSRAERLRVASLIADVCKADNSRFDRERFLTACDL